jgi:hypothetical protein
MALCSLQRRDAGQWPKLDAFSSLGLQCTSGTAPARSTRATYHTLTLSRAR